jgi:hypothetical protein
MKIIRRSFRVWFGVLLISAGVLCLEAIWAQQPVGPNGKKTAQDCYNDLGGCNRRCTTKFRHGYDYYARQDCYDNCDSKYDTCMASTNPAVAGGSTPGQTPPPNQTGPNSSPTPAPSPSATPRRHPIKGPPHRLGPSPSPTAKPILLDKPTSPTPSPKSTPKKSSSHGHH